MGDPTPKERPFQSKSAQPTMEVKITKPDERKGLVPPSLVPLPVATPEPLVPQEPPATQKPGLVPPRIIPPVQTKPPRHGKPRKK